MSDPFTYSKMNKKKHSVETDRCNPMAVNGNGYFDDWGKYIKYKLHEK